MCRRSSFLAGEGEGVDEEPNLTTARKPGSGKNGPRTALHQRMAIQKVFINYSKHIKNEPNVSRVILIILMVQKKILIHFEKSSLIGLATASVIQIGIFIR